jgi:hypothetical protein
MSRNPLPDKMNGRISGLKFETWNPPMVCLVTTGSAEAGYFFSGLRAK